MSQSGTSTFQLYDYGKLNTNSLFRRLMTDIDGKQLYDWLPDESEQPPEAWRWIQT